MRLRYAIRRPIKGKRRDVCAYQEFHPQYRSLQETECSPVYLLEERSEIESSQIPFRVNALSLQNTCAAQGSYL